MRRRDLLGLTVAGGILPAGCSREGRSRLIRVGVSPFMQSSGFYLANELGYFADVGLGAKVVYAGSGELVPLLAGGQMDVAMLALTPALVNALARGARFRLVAARGQLAPQCTMTGNLYWRRDFAPPGAEGLRKLRGKRIALRGGPTVSGFFLDQVLATVGMTVADVKVVPVGGNEALAAFRNGEVDVLNGGQFLDRDLTELAPELIVGFRVSDILPDFQVSHVQYGPTLLDEKHEAGAAFLRAYFRGVRAFREGATPEFLRTRARDEGMDPSYLDHICRDSISADGVISLEDLRRFIEWSVAKGYSETPVDPAAAVDTRFLEMGAGG